MRVIYEAENLIDAHLVKGVLEQHGIPVYVRGEYLTGAIGGLPVGGLVALCVDEAAVPAAQDVVAAVLAEREQPPDPAGDGDWEAVIIPA